MKKIFVYAVIVVVSLAMATAAMASMKPVEFAGGGAGKVTFDNKVHMGKGLKCTDCHDAIFKKKVGGNPMKMKDINEGKFCGACHNGTKAFKASDPANCGKCHKK
ncbi:MAG: cytochrome c3 family protein [Nitrospiraceae bacterium]|nr:cytochrome c3 family protein [Nitrospiraceae bacterium]